MLRCHRRLAGPCVLLALNAGTTSGTAAQVASPSALVDSINVLLDLHGSDSAPPIVRLDGEWLVFETGWSASIPRVLRRMPGRDASVVSRRAPTTPGTNRFEHRWFVEFVCRTPQCVEIVTPGGDLVTRRDRLRMSVWLDAGVHETLAGLAGWLAYQLRRPRPGRARTMTVPVAPEASSAAIVTRPDRCPVTMPRSSTPTTETTSGLLLVH